MSYVTREIHTTQRYCTVCATLACNCQTAFGDWGLSLLPPPPLESIDFYSFTDPGGMEG